MRMDFPNVKLYALSFFFVLNLAFKNCRVHENRVSEHGDNNNAKELEEKMVS
jgi:hypothetical protein